VVFAPIWKPGFIRGGGPRVTPTPQANALAGAAMPAAARVAPHGEIEAPAREIEPGKA